MLPFWGEWDPVSAARLRQVARRSPLPTILHAHSGHTAALAFLASQAGGPVTVAHRRVDFALSGVLARKLKYDSAGRVIAVSSAIARILSEQGLPRERIAVVTDAVPVGEDEARTVGEQPLRPASAGERQNLRARLSAEWRVPQDAPWIGDVAAQVPHKDPANLLRAVPAVLERQPRAVFWFVGDGPLRSELEALARSLGVSDSVRFTGRQASAADFLRAFDVFVLPSWGEGMGSVLLEAMACGAPIAATTAGGIPEVVVDGATGLLVPPRDSARLAGAVLRILEDRDLARRLSESAAARLERFSLSAQAAATEAVYDAVLAERSPSPRGGGLG